MKTYEGTFTIRWHKNIWDIRPLTIDSEDREALHAELVRIREEFNTKGDDPKCPQYRTWQEKYVPPYKITFDMHERK